MSIRGAASKGRSCPFEAAQCETAELFILDKLLSFLS